jgi:hypothetical protein
MVLRLSFDDSLEITMEDSVNRKAKGGGCVGDASKVAPMMIMLVKQ